MKIIFGSGWQEILAQMSIGAIFIQQSYGREDTTQPMKPTKFRIGTLIDDSSDEATAFMKEMERLSSFYERDSRRKFTRSHDSGNGVTYFESSGDGIFFLGQNSRAFHERL